MRIDGKKSSSPIRLLRVFIILMIVLAIGSIGYMVIERWAFFDALYMTVITITTVGYREVGEISEPGRLFTIFIIFSGVGIIGYIINVFTAFFPPGRNDT